MSANAGKGVTYRVISGPGGERAIGLLRTSCQVEPRRRICQLGKLEVDEESRTPRSISQAAPRAKERSVAYPDKLESDTE